MNQRVVVELLYRQWLAHEIARVVRLAVAKSGGWNYLSKILMSMCEIFQLDDQSSLDNRLQTLHTIYTSSSYVMSW